MLRQRIALISCCGLLFLLLGCGDKPQAVILTQVPQAVFVEPAKLALVAGGQMQLRAQINDAKGRPVGGASIVFQSKNPALVSVTPEGLVLSLGPAGDTGVTVASGVRLAQVPVHVSSGAASALELTQAAAKSTIAGGEIGEIKVKVRDEFNNPVAGAPLAWSTAKQSGTLTAASTTTGVDGTGTAHWSADTNTGDYTLNIVSGSLAPLVVRALVVPGPAAGLQIKTDPPIKAGASIDAGSTLRVWVSVLDANGNGVAQAQIKLSSAGDCGALDETRATDEMGTTPPIDWTTAASRKCILTARLESPALTSSLSLKIAPIARGRKR